MRRNFHFLGEITEDGLVEHDREEVRQALLDLEGALYQLGGSVSISAVRQQVGDDAYVTTGMVLTYDSFSPAIKQRSIEDELHEQLESEDATDGTAKPAP